jgi:hypothetical protein
LALALSEKHSKTRNTTVLEAMFLSHRMINNSSIQRHPDGQPSSSRTLV